MAQFPVEDSAGVLEGINYLLSGPAGLGQNFQGFSTYTPAYIRPTGREPFMLPITSTLDTSWYINRPINNVVALDSERIEVTFTTPYANPPFQYGDGITLENVVDTGGSGGVTNFDGSYSVFSCSSTSVVLYSPGNSYVWPTYISGGNLLRDYTTRLSTDCNAYVTIYGPTEQVFISNQLKCDFTYDYSSGGDFDVIVQINRYRGYPTDQTSLANNKYIFYFNGTVSEQIYSYTANSTRAESFENIFTTAIDAPNFGFYRYICEVTFDKKTSDATPGVFTAGLRSLTAQVIKQ